MGNDSVAENIAREYESWLSTIWEPRTVGARVALVRKRLKEWELEDFTSLNIQTWLGTSNFKPWTRSTYHAHLKDFCAWLVATNRLAANPMDDVRKGKRPRSTPRPLTDSEVLRIQAAATGDMAEWITLALHAGLRAHEIAKIAAGDITEESIYVEGKGGSRATIPTSEEIWEIAQRHTERGYWYPGKEDGHLSGNQISTRVGVLFHGDGKTDPGLGIHGSIHRCRHTYGTRLLRKGVNIRVVQELMRHASLASTQVYTAVSTDEKRDAIRLLSA